MEDTFNITSLFFKMAEQQGQTIAVTDKNGSISYGQLAADVNRMATYLLSKGLKKGDRILVFVPMSVSLYTTVLAIFRMGATAVFLDEWVNIKRMEVCCKLANCQGFIAPFKIKFLGTLLSGEIRKIPVKLKPTPGKHMALPSFEPTQLTDTALITFTTGSTGIPKAANRTHGFLNEQFKALEPLLSQTSRVDMPMLPIVLLLNLGKGKTSVVADFKASKPQSFSPQRLLEQINQHLVQSITTSPYYLLQLANYCLSHSVKIPLKQISVGGAPVFESDAAVFIKAFPEAEITIVYGSTEAEPISHISARDLVANQRDTNVQGLAVGKPDKSATVRIIHIQDGPISASQQEFDAMTKEAGQVGEIIVSGQHVLTSYINNPEAISRNKINLNGTIWHRTGDSGYINSSGHLFLLGRCMQIIQHANQVLYPFIIENQLKNYAGITAGTVVLKSGTPLIVIQTTPAFREEEFRRFLQTQQLEEILYRILPQIPMDKRHHSKIDYEALQKMA